ncbi:bifunctional 4-hydroxy-2-oxoglutarate aldolase/2-dehydro-3-deoxy-phosphogluconate aldolase [Thermoanaerobacterium thermosaccharolyticum]|uniref:bifunctional 4-hydroxy-2-oxoglutarate aldolase/2-dehydro-3-deoxy-phosphogluconate aldolase n=1 Tax=Thermoanaerobacterium thermosaccharolyticum TaxID=1517 RepID=UPI003DAA04CE
MNEILEKISRIGFIPIIDVEDTNNIIHIAKALIDGGMPITEIIYCAAESDKAIREIKEAFPEVLVGVGAFNIEQVKAAAVNGAQFVVNPGFNPKIVAYCKEIGIPIIPGCTTASDLGKAIESGIEVVEFFPAEQSGGIERIKAFSKLFRNIRFIPTGGINLKNLSIYLSCDNVLACGGSFMIKDEFIKNREWDKITSLSKQAVDVIMGFEIGHIGINASNEEEALKVANLFSSLLDLSLNVGNSSIFTGNVVEVMKPPCFGKIGHIAIKTNSIVRAKYHLETKGIRFNENSAKYDTKGNMTVIYMEQEIAGFAVHLLQK